MNVDVKILTKVLATRLKYILPDIIHQTQTAIYGRKIHNSIHLVRDLIQIANENNEEAAFIFLDQEKAFDRVDHKFLFDTMQAFGLGDSFINWVKIIYANASTRLNINGFLTEQIPLRRGVRQGCPLSAFLYILVIEILALQLRANPNIIGFEIEGEKIISSHYMDDATITITQNKCFKEVYKELQDYEKATGAKINYSKTKGLWTGKWKNRTDDPFQEYYTENDQKIIWTNGNIKSLGIYLGNDNPAIQTFEEILPKIRRKIDYWKPLKLPILAKARVIEIFHASPIWYAASFYPIPANIEKEMNNMFINYITFPKSKKNEISLMEMQKLRNYGGIKLMQTKIKSETPKIEWLINMITDEDLKIHLGIFKKLIGIQKGNIEGEEIIFADHYFINHILKIKDDFYIEALKGISKLDIRKHIPDIQKEPVFYNPIFTMRNEEDIDKTIKPFTRINRLKQIKTYGDLIQAEETERTILKLNITQKINSIQNIRENVPTNRMIGLEEEIEFTNITQKFIYSELIQKQSRDHIYQIKWFTDRKEEIGSINWDKIWKNIHNHFFTEETKSTIWEQIHLNFYTTYKYNTWHNTLQPCPLCNKIPEDVFHIILDCKFTNTMWLHLEKTLLKITPTPVTSYEKAFGLSPDCKIDKELITLRNWMTFTLRHRIMQEERKAYHRGIATAQQERHFAFKYNRTIEEEIKTKEVYYKYSGREQFFTKIVTANKVVANKNDDGTYTINDIM